jgi:hypothetical protein
MTAKTRAKDYGQHKATPIRVHAQSIAKITANGNLRSLGGTRIYARSLFQQLTCSERTSYRLGHHEDSRTLANSKIRQETRGRKPQLTERDLRLVERLLWRGGYDGRVVSWQDLLIESGLHVSQYTLKRAMNHKGYRRCIACRRSWVAPKVAAQRVKFAKQMLTKYPTPQHWRNVRFSDEVHFGYGPPGRVWVTRRPGEENCPDCVQQENQPREKDQKKVHCWAAVGYNYKSDLIRYETNNSNGKMTLQVYRDDILECYVKHWPVDAVLEEDGDSGHGKNGDNIVAAWKRQNNLKFFFNCVHSPDLAPIENAWQAPKAYLRLEQHWDDETVMEVATEGWEALSQATINLWVDTMPDRLRKVIAMEGQMTPF